MRLMNYLNQTSGSTSGLLGSMLTDVNAYTESFLPIHLKDYSELAQWELVNSNSFALTLNSKKILEINSLFDEQANSDFNFSSGTAVNTFVSASISGRNITLRLVDQNNEIRELTGTINGSKSKTLSFNCECNKEQVFSRNDFLLDKLNVVVNYVHNNFETIQEDFRPRSLVELGRYLNLPRGTRLGINSKLHNGSYEYYLAKTQEGTPILKVEVNGTNPFGLKHLRLDHSTAAISDNEVSIEVSGLPVSSQEATIDQIVLTSNSFCINDGTTLDIDPNDIVCPEAIGNGDNVDERGLQFDRILRGAWNASQSNGNIEYSSPDVTSFFYYYENPIIYNFRTSGWSDFTVKSFTFNVAGGNFEAPCEVKIEFSEGLVLLGSENLNPEYGLQFLTVANGRGTSTFRLNIPITPFNDNEYIRGTVNCILCTGIVIDNATGGDRCKPISICEDEELCIPQTVAAVPCNDQYEYFINNITTQVEDYQIPLFYLPTSITNYQYRG